MLALLFCAMDILAQNTIPMGYEFEYDGLRYTYTLYRTQYEEITGFFVSGSSQENGDNHVIDVVIPSTIIVPLDNPKEYDVVGIGSEAFKGCSAMNSITIPNSVLCICEAAFFGCSEMKSITIPTSVTDIGDKAFYKCIGLESIYIPAATTHIGNSFNFTNLKSIIVDANNNVYDSRNKCNAIIETSTQKIIAGCGNTVIPQSITAIGHSAFYGCIGLDTISIPEGIITIEDGAFYSSDLVSVTIPESVKCLGSKKGRLYHGVFENCSKLRSVIFKPVEWDSIGDFAFYGCSKIDSFVVSIDDGNPLIWFENYIGKKAFILDPTVTTVESSTLYVPKGRYSYFQHVVNRFYNDGSVFGQFATIKEILGNDFYIDDGINYLIKENEGVKYAIVDYGYYEGEIVIPSSVVIDGQEYPVKEIGKKAFIGCNKITTVALPEGLTCIDSLSFFDCGRLSSVLLPASLTSIGTNAFSNCEELSDVAFPTGLKSIGSHAFIRCNNLTSIYIPESVISIGVDAFGGCATLSSIIVHDDNALYDSRGNCNAIIETATNTLLNGCSNTVIPESVASIGSVAFYGNILLKSIIIPKSVIRIGDNAFADCINLISITIPKSVMTIESFAFYGCDNIQSVYVLSQNPPELGLDVFGKKTYANATLYVPDGAISSYQTADGWKMFKNIEVDTAVDPVFKDNKDSNNIGDAVIYDITGRRLKAESIELLNPGLYIINDRKYLIK